MRDLDKVSQTYRRGRMVDFIQRLMWRRTSIAEQMAQDEFAEIKPQLLGQIQALDLIIREGIKEFEISKDELK